MASEPYVELDRCPQSGWKIERLHEPFQLSQGPPTELAYFQTLAYQTFVGQKKIDPGHDDDVVRLADYDAGTATLRIQKCTYSDGIRSNYAMDIAGIPAGGRHLSLRELLHAEYGGQLPPLTETRLSNAIGCAVIVFYRRDDGELFPYLPRRAKGSAVFSSGGYHCTASGETQWRDSADSFDALFTGHICTELEEEVGLTREHLAWIYPISLCREMLRGGKPQLFFAAYTEAKVPELTHLRRAAIERQKARGRQEVEDDMLVTQALEDCTLEAIANLTLARQFIDSQNLSVAPARR
jgi:hypothetical protein